MASSLWVKTKSSSAKHTSMVRNSAAWFALIFLIVLAVGALIFATGTQQWVLLGISATGLAFVLYQMIPIWTTEIAVTNHRLVVKRGWLTRSTSELQLKSIEQVNFHQGLLGRLLDFGRIDIHGTGVDDLRLPNIGSPKDLLKAIENASIPLKQPQPPLADKPAA